MIFACKGGKSGRHQQYFGAGQRQQTVQLGEAHVVADAQADIDPRNIRIDDMLARQVGVGFPITPRRNVDIKQRDFAVGGNAFALRIKHQRGVVVFGAIWTFFDERPAMEPNAEAFGGGRKQLGCFAIKVLCIGRMVLFAPQKGHTFGERHQRRPLSGRRLNQLHRPRYIAAAIFLGIHLDESYPHFHASFARLRRYFTGVFMQKRTRRQRKRDRHRCSDTPLWCHGHITFDVHAGIAVRRNHEALPRWSKGASAHHATNGMHHRLTYAEARLWTNQEHTSYGRSR